MSWCLETKASFDRAMENMAQTGFGDALLAMPAVEVEHAATHGEFVLKWVQVPAVVEPENPGRDALHEFGSRAAASARGGGWRSSTARAASRASVWSSAASERGGSAPGAKSSASR